MSISKIAWCAFWCTLSVNTFVSTKRKGENRVRLLLNDLKLEHRIIDDTPELKPIDYAYAMKILPELRASSEAFLQKTLIKKE